MKRSSAFASTLTATLLAAFATPSTARAQTIMMEDQAWLAVQTRAKSMLRWASSDEERRRIERCQRDGRMARSIALERFGGRPYRKVDGAATFGWFCGGSRA